MVLKVGAKNGRKTDMSFQNWHLANFHRLKNSDLILETKMEQLHENKNSKQADRPDTL